MRLAKCCSTTNASLVEERKCLQGEYLKFDLVKVKLCRQFLSRIPKKLPHTKGSRNSRDSCNYSVDVDDDDLCSPTRLIRAPRVK